MTLLTENSLKSTNDPACTFSTTFAGISGKAREIMRGLALGGWNSTEGNGVASRVEIEGVAAAGGAAR